jgi:hypothetical protein
LAVPIDEGHNLAGVSVPRLQPTMEVLKSLTNVTGVVRVLAGLHFLAFAMLMAHRVVELITRSH